MKKITLLFLVVAMMFTASFTVSAYEDEEVTTDEKIDYLLSKGFPKEFLDGKEENMINDIYSQTYGENVKFLGTETVTLKEASNGGISTFGAIPAEDMKFTISKTANITYDTAKKRNRINSVSVYVDYDWTKKPFFSLEDGITVDWDYGVLTYKADSFKAYDYAKLPAKGWVTTHTYTAPATGDLGEIGYYADFKYSDAIIESLGASQYKGSASFTLLPKKSPMYLNSNANMWKISANYLHNQNPARLVLGFFIFLILGFIVLVLIRLTRKED